MKTKKYRGGGQGYADREDESLGMRTGAERTKRQSMRDRRDESYGAWGKRPNQRINRDVGGTAEEHKAARTSEATQELTRAQLKKAWKNLQDEAADLHKAASRLQKIRIDEFADDPKKKRAKGGVASFARGGVEEAAKWYRRAAEQGDADAQFNLGVMYDKGEITQDDEAADKEGSRLSVSMERQEDAGFSPSQADFDQQHRLAEEGIMDVGAAVTIVQGHDSREQLGETDGVRGGGAAIRGKNFRGVS